MNIYLMIPDISLSSVMCGFVAYFIYIGFL
jgi:hypothetical protein